MPERPSRPRRPDDGRTSPARDGEAMTFDNRRGRSSDSSARAIPTGRRGGPTPERGGPTPERRPRPQEPRTRVMPTGTPPSRPAGPPPQRPVGRGGPTGPRGPVPAGPAGAGHGRSPARKFFLVLLVLLLVWAVAMAWAIGSSWSKVQRVDATPDGQRPSSEGNNTLLVGSDSRAGLSAEEQQALGTGSDTGGARTDSILVLHTGSGKSTLLSIPRDSYVEIPGHGMNKINAAFSIGGAELLAETIEHNTGLTMDGYMEIGFGGFASVVDAVGGVRMCVENDMQDEKAHLDIQKGCQVLDGPTALGYVRARYSDPRGDIGRAERQREFLGALMGKMVSPANMLLPWRAHRLGSASAENLTIGEDDSFIGTARAMWAFRGISKGKGNSLVVPMSSESLATSAGTAVQWDEERSDALFEKLRNDEPLEVDPSEG